MRRKNTKTTKNKQLYPIKITSLLYYLHRCKIEFQVMNVGSVPVVPEEIPITAKVKALDIVDSKLVIQI